MHGAPSEKNKIHTRFAGTLPGHQMMHGTREPPSHADIFQPRSGSALPEWSRGMNGFASGRMPCVVSTQGPLSDVKTINVFSANENSFSLLTI